MPINDLLMWMDMLSQGDHIPAEIKFPLFSLSFPCVMTFFSVFFSIKLIDGFEC